MCNGIGTVWPKRSSRFRKKTYSERILLSRSACVCISPSVAINSQAIFWRARPDGACIWDGKPFGRCQGQRVGRDSFISCRYSLGRFTAGQQVLRGGQYPRLRHAKHLLFVREKSHRCPDIDVISHATPLTPCVCLSAYVCEQNNRKEPSYLNI